MHLLSCVLRSSRSSLRLSGNGFQRRLQIHHHCVTLLSQGRARRGCHEGKHALLQGRYGRHNLQLLAEKHERTGGAVRGHSEPEGTGELPKTRPFPCSRLWGQRKTTLGALELELTFASCIFVGMRKWVAGSAFCRKETGNRRNRRC